MKASLVGGEQGDPLMPALFALAMHQALVAPELPEERFCLFWMPDCIQPLFQDAPRCFYERGRISLNHVKKKARLWSAVEVEPPSVQQMCARAP